jgi:hypothetical protein
MGVNPIVNPIVCQKTQDCWRSFEHAGLCMTGPATKASLEPATLLTTDAKARKAAPVFSGVMRYFPKALVAVAELSKIGNDQHNPGQPMHWAREKSTDHGDCIARHQLEVGTIDTDGVRHAAKVAWRALAQLELEIEASERK